MSGPSEPEPPMAKMDDAPQPRPKKLLIVGLDTGTTCSGVAFLEFDSHSTRLSDVEIRTVRGWPSSHGPDHDESKVPTRLVYNATGKLIAWGYEEAEEDAIVIEWPKLAMVPEKDLAPHLRNCDKLKQTRKQMRKLGITPTQVMADYIRMIWTHAKAEIKKTIGERAFKSVPIYVVFTIPAIWGPQQIKLMKDAASTSILQWRSAGATTFDFVSEPEAAVHAYERQLQQKLGDSGTVLAADIGGGTGDTISYKASYEKVGEGEERELKLKEAVPGDGALCGAIFVDEAFEKLLLSRLPASHKDLKTTDPGAWRRILAEQWQHSIKRSFKWKGTGQIWPVILSNISSTRDVVRLHEDEIRDVFDSVMPAIIRLINQQIKQANPSIILLVGGFGRCPYLAQRLREEYSGGKSVKKGGRKKQKVDAQKIEVHSETGEMPWAAVCRGACKFGLLAQLKMSLVKSRVSRTSVLFIENAPGSAEDGGIWNPNFGEHMIPNKATYVVKKGDSIDTEQKSQKAMYMAFDIEARGIHCERAVFYAYDGDSPPARYDPNDTGFRRHGVMEITVPREIERLPIEHTDIGGRRVFDYRLQKETIGGSVQITAVDPANGDVLAELVLPELDTI